MPDACGVIDWAIVASAVTSAVTTGASMTQSATSVGYSVVCGVIVENWTKYPLTYPHSTVNGGIMQNPPISIKGGVKEQFVRKFCQ